MKHLMLVTTLVLFGLPSQASAQTIRDGMVCLEDVCRPLYRDDQSPGKRPPPQAKQPPQARPAAPAPAPAASAPPPPQVEKVAIQIGRNDPGLMNLALNNAQNVLDHYKKAGRQVEIEFVAYGPGLHMVRSDTSPVRERLTTLLQDRPQGLRFRACARTLKEQSAAEEQEITLLQGVSRVVLGVAHLVHLHETGFRTLRP